MLTLLPTEACRWRIKASSFTAELGFRLAYHTGLRSVWSPLMPVWMASDTLIPPQQTLTPVMKSSGLSRGDRVNTTLRHTHTHTHTQTHTYTHTNTLTQQQTHTNPHKRHATPAP